jgi:hypothetical protein
MNDILGLVVGVSFHKVLLGSIVLNSFIIVDLFNSLQQSCQYIDNWRTGELTLHTSLLQCS